MSKPFITLIAAMDSNNGIGINNKLPWKLPEDMANFRRNTIDQNVLMGRKTFESIGRPLEYRRNIVLSRTADLGIKDVTIVSSIEHALSMDLDSLVVIGGSEVYKETIDLADRIHITEIYGPAYNCDSFFPKIDLGIWKAMEGPWRVSADNDIKYRFVLYTRK
jgi:dihydrofolate reductase